MGDKTKNWVFTILIAVLGFMLKFEFNRITQSIDNLSSSMTNYGEKQVEHTTVQNAHSKYILDIQSDNDIQDARIDKCEKDIIKLQVNH